MLVNGTTGKSQDPNSSVSLHLKNTVSQSFEFLLVLRCNTFAPNRITLICWIPAESFLFAHELNLNPNTQESSNLLKTQPEHHFTPGMFTPDIHTICTQFNILVQKQKMRSKPWPARSTSPHLPRTSAMRRLRGFCCHRTFSGVMPGGKPPGLTISIRRGY